MKIQLTLAIVTILHPTVSPYNSKQFSLTYRPLSQREVAARLDSCPEIARLLEPGGDVEARARILDWLRPLMSLRESKARSALKAYLNKHGNAEEPSKVCIIFTRMYFEVPPEATATEAGSTNPFYGHVGGGKVRNALYPLEWHNGKLEFTGVLGQMAPIPYVLEWEFDSFSKKYGRRKWR